MTKDEAIERVRVCMEEAFRQSAAYNAKADQARGYSRHDKVRFRHLAGEYKADAEALKMLLEGK